MPKSTKYLNPARCKEIKYSSNLNSSPRKVYLKTRECLHQGLWECDIHPHKISFRSLSGK